MNIDDFEWLVEQKNIALILAILFVVIIAIKMDFLNPENNLTNGIINDTLEHSQIYVFPWIEEHFSGILLVIVFFLAAVALGYIRLPI